MTITVDVQSAEQTPHLKYRADIDGLRAIAVLSVVSFHAFPSWVRGGFIGVDIFFVISGFLISTIIFRSLERKTFSFLEFYSRRIKRIFPALLIVLIVSYGFGWFALLADEYKQLGKHIAGAAGFVSNFVLWRESGYFDNGAVTKPLLHLWSLGVEEQYYIVWPLLLWLASKRNFNLLTIAVAIAVISFSINVGEIGRDKVAAFYSPQTRFWELIAGSILAYATLYRQTAFTFDAWFNTIIFAKPPDPNGYTPGNTQSFLGAVLIVAGILLIDDERKFPGWWAILPAAGAVLIISAGPRTWLNRVVLSNRVMVWFGLISYPLYLWHWPLLSFARIYAGETIPLNLRMASVLAAIALAWLTYQLIEKPVRFGGYSKAKTATLLMLMLVIGYAGFNCYERDGLGFRLPKAVRELTQYKYNDPHNAWRAGTCHLLPNQDFKVFETCKSETKGDNNFSLLLWGDSYAAHLYAGYKNTFGEKFDIIQRTASSCPPILSAENEGDPLCKAINDDIYKLILAKRPTKIVLVANWVAYDIKNLEYTVNQLHRIGIRNIDLVGPMPQWVDTLPKQLYLYYKADSLHRIPERMKFGLNEQFRQRDQLMSALAEKLKVNYISPVKILCNESGCMTRWGEDLDTLIQFDAGHLTESGAQFLVSNFAH